MQYNHWGVKGKSKVYRQQYHDTMRQLRERLLLEHLERLKQQKRNNFHSESIARLDNDITRGE